MNRGRFQRVLFLAAVVGLSGCAGTLHHATYQDYRAQGRRAEAAGDWAVAEIAYNRALTNVYWGRLGPEFEAKALYDAARAARHVGKPKEAEELLKKALEIDDKLHGREGFLVGYTLAELAAVYFDLKKLQEGIPLLMRLEPIVQRYYRRYTDQAQTFMKTLYERYSSELSSLGMTSEAERFRNVAASL